MRTKNEIVTVLTGALQLIPEENEITDDLMEVINQVEKELEYAEARYKAREEMHNNSIAYAAKIQKELNGLKRDVKRYFKLLHNPTENKDKTKIRPYIEWANELMALEEKLKKPGKKQ